MILTFDVTAEQTATTVALSRIGVKHFLRKSWPMKIGRGLLSCVAGILVLVVIGAARSEPLRFIGLTIAGLVAVLAVGSFVYGRVGSKLFLAEFLRPYSFPIRTTLEVNDAGLTLSDATGTRIYPWARIRYLEALSGIDAIHMTGLTVLVVPNAAFVDSATRSAFADLIKTNAKGL